MRTLLPGFGTAALGLAVLLTFALALTTKRFTLRPPGGPDGVGLVVVLLLPVAAWVLVLVAALACVGLGGFDWVSRSPGIPTLAVLATTVGLAILSTAAAMFSLEVRYASRTAIGLAGGLVLPLAVVAFLGALLWSAPATVAAARWPRPAGVAFAGLAALAFAGGLVFLLLQSAEQARSVGEALRTDEERSAEIRSASAALAKRQAAELAGLPDDAPIEEFLAHLFVDAGEEHRRKAVERIRALPGLTARLAKRLEHPNAHEREHVLSFVAMAGTPDPAWKPLVRRAILRLADDYRAEATGPATGRIGYVKGLAWRALLAAERFGPDRLEPEARTLREAVALWPDEGPRQSALEIIDLYLAGKPLPTE